MVFVSMDTAHTAGLRIDKHRRYICGILNANGNRFAVSGRNRQLPVIVRQHNRISAGNLLAVYRYRTAFCDIVH